MMSDFDHAACTTRVANVPPDDYAAYEMPATSGQRIHSHSYSQNHSFLTSPFPVQGEEMGELTLRPYQANAVQELRSLMARGVTRIILYSPTGSGKTEIGMDIVKSALAKGKRVAFLANRIQLVGQTSRRFMKSGIPHGIIQGKNTCRTYQNVLIASIKTVAQRGLPDVDLLIIDEAHAVAGSKAYINVIRAAKCPVIGLSATPFSKGLGKHYSELAGSLFEKIAVAATISELIADGHLVDCDVYAPSEPDMAGIKQVRNAFGEMDYADADIGRATDKPELVGDIVNTWLKRANGTTTVCFASNISHSKHIVEQFKAAGISAEHIDCYTKEDERQAILNRITTGETQVISNVGILAEGWDFPACKTLILARPTKSLIRYIQMAGRVLRPHTSKTRAMILDHSGTVTRLGFPTDELPLELDDGTSKFSNAAKKREKTLPKPCPSCSYLKTGHKCPICGFAPEIQDGVNVKDGELVLVKRKKSSRLEKQAFYSQLIDIAGKNSYRYGWVAHTYKEYFGTWPKGLKNVAMAPTLEVTNYLKHLRIRKAKAKEARRAAY